MDNFVGIFKENFIEYWIIDEMNMIYQVIKYLFQLYIMLINL